MDEKTISGGSGPSLSWGRTVFAEKKEETYEKTTFEHFLCPVPVPDAAADGGPGGRPGDGHAHTAERGGRDRLRHPQRGGRVESVNEQHLVYGSKENL